LILAGMVPGVERVRRPLRGLSGSVAGHREDVDHHSPAEHLDLLTAPSQAVSPAEEQGVLQGPVERFGVVPAPVEAREVRVRGRDGPNVLVIVEVTVGDLVREVNLNLVAKGDSESAAVVVPADAAGSPRAEVVSYTNP
jgi:hypothetical protein